MASSVKMTCRLGHLGGAAGGGALSWLFLFSNSGTFVSHGPGGPHLPPSADVGLRRHQLYFLAMPYGTGYIYDADGLRVSKGSITTIFSISRMSMRNLRWREFQTLSAPHKSSKVVL